LHQPLLQAGQVGQRHLSQLLRRRATTIQRVNPGSAAEGTSLLVNGLRQYIADEKAKQRGFGLIEVTLYESTFGVPSTKRFRGAWIISPKEPFIEDNADIEPNPVDGVIDENDPRTTHNVVGEIQMTFWAVAETQKGQFAVLQFARIDEHGNYHWRGPNDRHAFEENEPKGATLYVIPTLEEFEDSGFPTGLKQELIERRSNRIVELDI
jgi:hypothetical protein